MNTTECKNCTGFGRKFLGRTNFGFPMYEQCPFCHGFGRIEKPIEIHDWCNQFPLWKRVFKCLSNYKKWRLARAHNTVAVWLLLTDNHGLGESVRKAGDKIWAEIYDLPKQKTLDKSGPKS